MKYYFWTFIFFLFVLSCSDDITSETFEVGEEWTETNTKVFFIDTFTVKASTFKFDSIVTSNTQRILVGAYTDPVFGKLSSKSFIEFQNKGTDYEIDNEAVFDSIVFILNYDSYHYNDTLSLQNYRIHEVTDDIKIDDDNFYNTTTFPYDTEIASHSFHPRPNAKDSLHISLDNAFGEGLFEKLQENDINSAEELLNYYKGLVIIPDEANTAVLGFTADTESTYIRMYYSIPSETESEAFFKDFTVNTAKLFNHVESDPTGTFATALTDQEIALPSTASNDNIYIQSGTGIGVKVEIPYLKDLYNISGDGVLMSANLVIKPSINSYSETLAIRDSLLPYIVDQNTDIVTQLLRIDNSPVYGLLNNEDSEFNTRDYTIPIDFYVAIELEERNEQNLSLILLAQDLNASVDRYIFDGENNPEDRKIKLELTYAIYDED